MLASLSLRNMKRQLSEYKIYWLSLIGVVALMYAFNSLIVSPTIVCLQKAETVILVSLPPFFLSLLYLRLGGS